VKPLLRNWPRLLGVALVVVLLVRADLSGVSDTLSDAHIGGLLLAFVLLLPMILLKSIRWQVILAAQGVRLGTLPAYLSYLGSMFLGVVTPGRVGEFARIFQVTEAHGVSRTLAFSSVLADRLFDLYLLLTLGALALAAVTDGGVQIGVIVVIAVAAGIPLAAVLSDTVFGWVQAPVRWGREKVPKLPWRLFDMLVEVRTGLRSVTGPALAVSAMLTAEARETRRDQVVNRLRKLAESRASVAGLALMGAWAAIVFGFYFSFKAREIWPKVVEVLGGG
jgi:uncharacterized membrane protein YbhN (UPF0104 family)